MPLIKPFAGLRPNKIYVKDVAAPPYDVLSSDEARIKAKDKPYSFLHISKAEIDLPESIDPFDAAVYQKGADNLQQLINDNILFKDEAQYYYVYRLTMGQHQQTGLVAVASVDAYDQNRIKKHEFTRPQKEDDRVNQINALNAQTGPVFLVYKSQSDVDDLLINITKQSPEYDLIADDGIQHEFWVIKEDKVIDAITVAFNNMCSLYIADGHHRSAAASRVATMKNNLDKNDASHYFLSVIFPHNQMEILDYNRVVKDLNQLDDTEFLIALNTHFNVEKHDLPVKPKRPGTFGMYLSSQWYLIKLKSQYMQQLDPVSALDVSKLSHFLIEPILNITDPRRDSRIDFVGGIRGLEELERRVDSGNMKIAFSLYPTKLEDLMAVADAGEVMPPKSTWFEPKLADGLVSHLLD